MDYIRLELVAPPSGPICDFCSDPKVHANFCANEFTDKSQPEFSASFDGVWAACETCSQLIQRQDWSALLDRSVDQFMQKYGIAVEERLGIRQEIAHIHQRFVANRRMSA